MRYITVPPKIHMLDPVSRKPTDSYVTFQDFIHQMLLDARFATGEKAIDAAYFIGDALDNLAGEEVLAIESAHWELLRTSVAEPTGGYKPGIGVQMRPFIKAVLEATESAKNGKATKPEGEATPPPKPILRAD